MDGTATASSSAPGSSPPEPIQPGEILLHIGPHKTGTSSVQSAFHAQREVLLARGIRYAGSGRQASAAAQAAVARRGDGSAGSRSLGPWHRLLRNVRRARDARVVISSEFFADAGPDTIRMLTDELVVERLHVVVTLRALARILPSQWQQYVKGGLTLGYEPWLEEVLGTPPGMVTPSFWARHRHDALVRRWADVVGPERVTVIVVEERDPGAVLRAFEALLGLDQGILVPEASRPNRSLTLPEVELVRAIQVALATESIKPSLRRGFVLYGVATALQRRLAASHEPRIDTPPWAVERAVTAAFEIVRGIRASGVTVVGDLEALQAAAAPGPDPRGSDALAIDWPGIATAAAIGALDATGLSRRAWAPDPAAGEVLRLVPTSRLAVVLLGRLRDRVDRSWRAVRAMRRRTRADSPGVAARPLSDVQRRMLDAFQAAYEERRLGSDLYEDIRRDIESELGREWETDDLPREAVIGAAMTIGVLRAGGRLSAIGRERAVPPPLAGDETYEFVAIPTTSLGVLVSRRLLRSAVARVRPPRRRGRDRLGSG